MKTQLDKKLNRVALARARDLREAEGVLYDLNDPFDRELFEAVLIDCINNTPSKSTKEVA